jgi:hypothetical protein
MLERRIPVGRGFAVDTADEPYPNSHLDGIADGVFPTDGSSRRTSSSLNLFSRAELEKEPILFSRMLDKLD